MPKKGCCNKKSFACHTVMIMRGKKDVDKMKIGMSFLSGTLKQIILKNLKTFYIFQSLNYKDEA